MTDDLNKKRPKDASKVNIHESWEVAYWCKKWNVTKEQLITAVKVVGVSSLAVAKYLEK